jgi:hypothetical protein
MEPPGIPERFSRRAKSQIECQETQERTQQIELTTRPEVGFGCPRRKQVDTGSKPGDRSTARQYEKRQMRNQNCVQHVQGAGYKHESAGRVPLEERIFEFEKEKADWPIEPDQPLCEYLHDALCASGMH